MNSAPRRRPAEVSAVDYEARRRADKAQSDIESHEEICAERYQNINSSIGDLKSDIRRGGTLAAGMIISLLAWFAVSYMGEFKENMQLKREILEQQVEPR